MRLFANVEPMSTAQAGAYLTWAYASPYEFYITPPHGLAEAMAEITGDNGMDFYAVLDETGAMTGMFEYEFHDGVMEIGLGIAPPHCGQGFGREFLRLCIDYGRRRYGYAGPVTLQVADFNARALALYTAAGFVETDRRQASSYGTPVIFIYMQLG